MKTRNLIRYNLVQRKLYFQSNIKTIKREIKFCTPNWMILKISRIKLQFTAISPWNSHNKNNKFLTSLEHFLYIVYIWSSSSSSNGISKQFIPVQKKKERNKSTELQQIYRIWYRIPFPSSTNETSFLLFFLQFLPALTTSFFIAESVAKLFYVELNLIFILWFS